MDWLETIRKAEGLPALAAAAQQGEGEQIIAHKYKGEIEMLPTPLIVTPMYLIVNKQFYQKHQAQVDAYWDAVRQARSGK